MQHRECTAGKLLVGRPATSSNQCRSLPCEMKTSQQKTGQYARTDLQIARNCSCRQHTQQKLLMVGYNEESQRRCSKCQPSALMHADTYSDDGHIPNTLLSNAFKSGVLQWRHDPAWPTLFSAAVSVRPDQWCVFCTSSLAAFPTCCTNQLVNL